MTQHHQHLSMQCYITSQSTHQPFLLSTTLERLQLPSLHRQLICLKHSIVFFMLKPTNSLDVSLDAASSRKNFQLPMSSPLCILKASPPHQMHCIPGTHLFVWILSNVGTLGQEPCFPLLSPESKS